jgi:hypothetical protein
VGYLVIQGVFSCSKFAAIKNFNTSSPDIIFAQAL